MFFLSIPYVHLIRVLHWCTDHVITTALESMDLTSAQGHVMGFLSSRERPPCPRDVEEAFQLSHPTVSGILSRLEQKGFIQLLPDSNDRRCKRIHIQPKGLACNQTMHQTMQHNEERLVQGFTLEEKEQFARLLQRAISNMGGSPCNFSPKEEPKK
ncbi:MAG: MarR family winged helix-turn-helix transcriptional regulator [Faecousia sp.]